MVFNILYATGSKKISLIWWKTRRYSTWKHLY